MGSGSPLWNFEPSPQKDMEKKSSLFQDKIHDLHPCSAKIFGPNSSINSSFTRPGKRLHNELENHHAING